MRRQRSLTHLLQCTNTPQQRHPPHLTRQLQAEVGHAVALGAALVHAVPHALAAPELLQHRGQQSARPRVVGAVDVHVTHPQRPQQRPGRECEKAEEWGVPAAECQCQEWSGRGKRHNMPAHLTIAVLPVAGGPYTRQPVPRLPLFSSSAASRSICWSRKPTNCCLTRATAAAAAAPSAAGAVGGRCALAAVTDICTGPSRCWQSVESGRGGGVSCRPSLACERADGQEVACALLLDLLCKCCRCLLKSRLLKNKSLRSCGLHGGQGSPLEGWRGAVRHAACIQQLITLAAGRREGPPLRETTCSAALARHEAQSMAPGHCDADHR